jgi:hypothetical protein
MSQNTIYFPYYGRPHSGGDFVNIEHITALNRFGFNAKALYLSSDLGYLQFPVPTVKAAGLKITAHDIMVVPELHGGLFNKLKSIDCMKVMHNQAPYYTFFGFETVRHLNEYPLTHIITCSEFAKKMLRELGVTKPILLVRPSIPSYFSPAEKRLQIAFTPYKRTFETSFVAGIFKSRFPELAHIPWVRLTDMSRQACAEAMAQSAVYAAFPRLEALSLMSLEAMASGCHLVGYTGNGGDEYATDDNGFWIEEGDHATFAVKLKEACDLVSSKAPNRYVENGLLTARGYSQEAFEQQLSDVYMHIMGPMADRYRI